MLHFIRQRFRSFGYAFQGIAILFKTQVHAQIHLFAAVLVIAMATYFGLKAYEWAVLILCIIIVLAAEAFNTAIEYLTDIVSPDYLPLAGRVKDLAAAAVLICALGALIIGILILGPYILYQDAII